MNYEWGKINKKGNIETGLYLQYTTIPEEGYPETMIIIHCFGFDRKILWCSARIYF